MLFFSKKLNFNKNETELKLENPTHAFTETSVVLQFTQEPWIKNETVMSWSWRKKKVYIFPTFILTQGNFVAFLYFISVHRVLNKFSECIDFYISKTITSYNLLLVFKIVKTQSAFTYSKLTIETLEQGLKHVQS